MNNLSLFYFFVNMYFTEKRHTSRFSDTTSNINTVKQELTDLITTTTNTLKSNMEATFANINTSIRGVNKPGQIMESIVDFEQYQKMVGTTDIFTRSGDGAISFFTINRRWQEGNWSSIPLKADWTTYNKLMIIGQRGSVMCCVIDTGVLERLLRVSGIYCGFHYAGSEAWLEFVPTTRISNSYFADRGTTALTTATKLSIWNTTVHISDILGIKYQ